MTSSSNSCNGERGAAVGSVAGIAPSWPDSTVRPWFGRFVRELCLPVTGYFSQLFWPPGLSYATVYLVSRQAGAGQLIHINPADGQRLGRRAAADAAVSALRRVASRDPSAPRVPPRRVATERRGERGEQ